MIKILFSLFVFTLTLKAAMLHNITPAQLEQMIQKNAVVIDIRTPPEWKETGVIPTSKKLMFFDEKGSYDLQKWLDTFKTYVSSNEQKVVLVCRSGNRTGVVGNFLAQKMNMTNIYHLQNGIKSWIKDGRKTIK
jgi:rhodanese-related sulfurtransferase